MWHTRNVCKSDFWSFHHPQRRPESLGTGNGSKRSPHRAGTTEICVRNLVHVTFRLCIKRVELICPGLAHCFWGVLEHGMETEGKKTCLHRHGSRVPRSSCGTGAEK